MNIVELKRRINSLKDSKPELTKLLVNATGFQSAEIEKVIHDLGNPKEYSYYDRAMVNKLRDNSNWNKALIQIRDFKL